MGSDFNAGFTSRACRRCDGKGYVLKTPFYKNSAGMRIYETRIGKERHVCPGCDGTGSVYAGNL